MNTTASIEACVKAVEHHRRLQGQSENTIRLDAWVLRALAVRPDEATMADLEAVLMRSKVRSTRASYASRIRSCFTLLRQLGMISTTVDQQLPKMSAPTTLPRPLTDEQIARLMSQAQAPMLDAIRIALLTGARSSEVWGLRGDDLSGGIHGPELLLRGKGAKDVHVPAHPQVVEIIEGYGTLGRLFTCWRDPKHLSEQCGNEMRRVLGEVVEFHQCRHAFATRLLKATDGDLRVVQTLLRHSSINTTLIYAKLADERPRQAIDLLAAI